MQDTQDKTIIRLTYSQDYLLAHEGGQQIGGTIYLTESETLREFDPYSFNLKCNTKPPLIEDAAIMKTGSDSQTYVLAFSCPRTDGIHNDIESITINGVTYSAVPDGSGSLSFESDKFRTTRPASLIAINRLFSESTPNAVYFLSGDTVPNNDSEAKKKTFTIGLTDSAGLRSSTTIEAREPKTSVATVVDNSNQPLSESGTNILKIDSRNDATWSTVTVRIPTTDEAGNSLLDFTPMVHWTLKDSSGTNVTQTPSVSNPSPENVDLKIPQDGEYVLTAYTSADGHSNSVIKTYTLKLVYEKLSPPTLKNGSTVLTQGQSTSLNNYVEVGSSGKASVTVVPPSTDENGASFINGSTVNIRYTTDGSTPSETSNSPSSNTIPNLEAGQYTIKLYASKPGYKDSDVVTYRVRPFSTDLYVKSSTAASNPGNDSTGLGTQASPFASIAGALNEIKKFSKAKDYTIHVIGEIKGSSSVSNITTAQATKLTIQGQDGGTLNGDNSSSALSTNVTVPLFIKDLKITGGKAAQGGGLNINSGSVTLQSGVEISANSATNSGGGIYNKGSLTIESGAVIKSNSAAYGGGIYNDSASSALTIRGEVSSNSATSYGGAIYAAKGFTVENSASIPSSGTRKQNDVYLNKTSGGSNISVNISGTISGAGYIYLDGTTGFYTYGYPALSGNCSSNYSKFKVIKPSTVSWKVDSDGKVKFDCAVSVTYDVNITDTKASPLASSFTFKKSGIAISNPDSVSAAYFGTTSAPPARPSSEYYIGSSDKVYTFNGWKNAAGTVDLGQSVTNLPESLLTGLTTPSVTLKAKWTETTDSNAVKSAWQIAVYDANFYSNHDTFNIYTQTQIESIFSASGALRSESFKGKTIKLMNNFDIYSGHGNFNGTLDGNGKTITAHLTNASPFSSLGSNDGGSALIKNLTIGGTITLGTDGGGGIADWSYSNSTIQNCTVSGQITASNLMLNSWTGGFVGESGSTITGCTFTGTLTVSGDGRVGGFVGCADPGSVITGNNFGGNLNGTNLTSYANVGAIVGEAMSSTTISSNTRSGNVTKGSATLNSIGL